MRVASEKNTFLLALLEVRRGGENCIGYSTSYNILSMVRENIKIVSKKMQVNLRVEKDFIGYSKWYLYSNVLSLVHTIKPCMFWYCFSRKDSEFAMSTHLDKSIELWSRCFITSYRKGQSNVKSAI